MRSIALLTFLSACGIEQGDCVYKKHTWFFDTSETISCDEVKRISACWENYVVSIASKKSIKAVLDTAFEVRIEDHPKFPGWGKDTPDYSYTYQGQIVVRVTAWQAAYMHELGHLLKIRKSNGQISDPEHLDKNFWQAVEEDAAKECK